MKAITVTQLNKKNFPNITIGAILEFSTIPATYYYNDLLFMDFQDHTEFHEDAGFLEVVSATITDEVNEKLGAIYLDSNVYRKDVVSKSPEEIEAINLQMAYAPIQAEFDMYQKRKADGVDAYLLQSAKLRLAKLSGQITEEGHSAIEELLRPVRDEVVNGQWINAKAKLEAIGSESVGIDFYTELHTELTTYINENY